MLFHIREAASARANASPSDEGDVELSYRGSRRAKVRVNAMSVVWAILIVAQLIGASFLAHYLNFSAGETVFLNLTVAVTSASAGAFIGEKLALGG